MRLRNLPHRALATGFVVVGIISTYFNVTKTQIYTRGWELSSVMEASIMPLCQGTDSVSDSDASNPMRKTNITTTSIRLGEHKPRLFHCGGYALNRNLQPTLQSIFPEYIFFDLRQVSDWKIDKNLSSHPWDLYVTNYQLDECQDPSFYQWLQLRFAGKVIFWTPEDARNYLPIVSRTDQFYPLGPGAPLTVTFLQTAFWAQIPDQEKQTFFVGTTTSPPQRPRSHGKLFLIYAHSHCVGERQSAFRKIANFKGGVLPTVYHGGRCNGGMKQVNLTKFRPYPNKVRLGNWEDNRYIYQDFRFCLTMEHANTPGYITEKILVAFWAGCIPIYWGPKEILDIFNADSFIYWDVDDPQPALDLLQYLEENQSAYDEMIQQPVLVPGALEKYFSFDQRYGRGQLKDRIRRYLGLLIWLGQTVHTWS